MAVVTYAGVEAWTRNSLKHRRSEIRGWSRRCRKAYTKGPYKDACEILADAYDKAAQVIDDALRDMAVPNEAKSSEP